MNCIHINEYRIYVISFDMSKRGKRKKKMKQKGNGTVSFAVEIQWEFQSIFGQISPRSEWTQIATKKTSQKLKKRSSEKAENVNVFNTSFKRNQFRSWRHCIHSDAKNEWIFDEIVSVIAGLTLVDKQTHNEVRVLSSKIRQQRKWTDKKSNKETSSWMIEKEKKNEMKFEIERISLYWIIQCNFIPMMNQWNVNVHCTHTSVHIQREKKCRNVQRVISLASENPFIDCHTLSLPLFLPVSTLFFRPRTGANKILR